MKQENLESKIKTGLRVAGCLGATITSSLAIFVGATKSITDLGFGALEIISRAPNPRSVIDLVAPTNIAREEVIVAPRQPATLNPVFILLSKFSCFIFLLFYELK